MHVLPNDIACASVNSASQLRDHIETVETVLNCWGAPQDAQLAYQCYGTKKWHDLTQPALITNEPMYAEDVLYIQSSNGYFVTSYRTGKIIEANPHNPRDPECLAEMCKYERFNPLHVSAPADPEPNGHYDILYIGHWDEDGKYDPPASFEREAYGLIETLEPRWIDIA